MLLSQVTPRAVKSPMPAMTIPPQILMMVTGIICVILLPRYIESPVASIVSEAIIEFGTSDICIERIPYASPKPRLSRFEANAMMAAANNNISDMIYPRSEAYAITTTDTRNPELTR